MRQVIRLKYGWDIWANTPAKQEALMAGCSEDERLHFIPIKRVYNQFFNTKVAHTEPQEIPKLLRFVESLLNELCNSTTVDRQTAQANI